MTTIRPHVCERRRNRDSSQGRSSIFTKEHRACPREQVRGQLEHERGGSTTQTNPREMSSPPTGNRKRQPTEPLFLQTNQHSFPSIIEPLGAPPQSFRLTSHCLAALWLTGTRGRVALSIGLLPSFTRTARTPLGEGNSLRNPLHSLALSFAPLKDAVFVCVCVCARTLRHALSACALNESLTENDLGAPDETFISALGNQEEHTKTHSHTSVELNVQDFARRSWERSLRAATSKFVQAGSRHVKDDLLGSSCKDPKCSIHCLDKGRQGHSFGLVQLQPSPRPGDQRIPDLLGNFPKTPHFGPPRHPITPKEKIIRL